MILPGSTLSGQCARYRSFPIVNPALSKIGFIVSSVDIGAIVDSMMTVFPFSRYGRMDSHAVVT